MSTRATRADPGIQGWRERRPVGPAPRRLLGRRVRVLRESAGLSNTEVAARLKLTRPTLSKIEAGCLSMDINQLRDLLGLYGVPADQWGPNERLCQQARQPGWWRKCGLPNDSYVAVEAGARRIREFSGMVIPELLWTRDYAYALGRSALTPPGKYDDLIRRKRQRRLDEELDLRLDAVIAESALRRPVGGHQVWGDQLAHLWTTAKWDTVTLRVLPDSVGAHPGLGSGDFTVLSFAPPDDPAVSCVRHLGGDSFLYQPGQVKTAIRLFDRLRALALPETDSMILLEELIPN